MIDKTVLINEPKTILLFIFKKIFFSTIGNRKHPNKIKIGNLKNSQIRI